MLGSTSLCFWSIQKNLCSFQVSNRLWKSDSQSLSSYNLLSRLSSIFQLCLFAEVICHLLFGFCLVSTARKSRRPSRPYLLATIPFPHHCQPQHNWSKTNPKLHQHRPQIACLDPKEIPYIALRIPQVDFHSWPWKVMKWVSEVLNVYNSGGMCLIFCNILYASNRCLNLRSIASCKLIKVKGLKPMTQQHPKQHLEQHFVRAWHPTLLQHPKEHPKHLEQLPLQHPESHRKQQSMTSPHLSPSWIYGLLGFFGSHQSLQRL